MSTACPMTTKMPKKKNHPRYSRGSCARLGYCPMIKWIKIGRNAMIPVNIKRQMHLELILSFNFHAISVFMTAV